MKMKKENGMITESFDYDCTSLLALEQYLELKSNEGLMLLGVRGGRFRFERSAPKKLRYCAVVRPAPGKDPDYVSFCEDAGWELAAEDGDVLIFRTEDAGLPRVETDPEEVFRAVKRSSLLKRLPLPLFGVIIAALLYQNALRPDGSLKDAPAVYACCALWVLIGLAIFAAVTLNDMKWLKKARLAAMDRKPLPFYGLGDKKPGVNAFTWIALALFLLLIAVFACHSIAAAKGLETFLELFK